MLKIMLIVKQGVSSESITREHVAVTSLRQQKNNAVTKNEIAILNSSILFFATWDQPESLAKPPMSSKCFLFLIGVGSTWDGHLGFMDSKMEDR